MEVILKTNYGDLEIELWGKECPKAVRNFVQLCLEGYYHKTVTRFHFSLRSAKIIVVLQLH